ncbi:long-chain fatty acid transport protein 2-like [Liolophura sinensis]|uniref:long-chain fatty acid transport protein 2-like n=1 Tax=Liolophura sinensis TaxID=3198878 RepID=UPI0031580305
MSMYQKAAIGALGAVGTSYAAYKLMFPWLALDSKDIAMREKFMEFVTKSVENKLFIIERFERHVTENPDKYFVIFEDRLYTYQQVDEEANKIARVVKTWNLQKGDLVALYMSNEPAFVWTFLGFQKLGIPVSLLNCNLTHAPLAHCINVCDAKAVVCSGDPDLVNALGEIRSSISGIPVYVHGTDSSSLPSSFTSLPELVATVPGDQTPKEWRTQIQNYDPLAYIYTSGTTGLPKPALLTQLKGIVMGELLRAQVNLSDEDIMYTCLPLYHSTGFYVGLFNVIARGATVVLSRKFSSSHFWEDCRKHKVTGFQYIGELCRFLLLRPPHPKDGEHCIRFAYGNGLREDIWEEFQTRFKIPHIFEFFAATDGPSGFVNLHNKKGAIGRLSPYVAWRDNFSRILVKFDLATAEPIRDKNGRCIRVKTGEPGLLLTAFPPYIKPDDIYLGDKKQVEKKLVRDVMVKGDIYFNYGDILYQDKDYFVYFTDRIGDTFRWKGENVSTLEVANVLSTLDFVLDANVYGVTVPGHDGRAGMACVVLKDRSAELKDDLRKAIYRHCVDNLPKYARPLFLRIQTDMLLTSTHKQKKVELVKEGFDINKIPHSLYVIDNTAQTYVPLTEPLFLRLMAGNSKL